jgi:hypothetical protein
MAGAALTGVLAAIAAFLVSLPDRSRLWLILPAPAARRANLLDLLVELADEMRRPVGLQDEEIDQLNCRRELAIDADGLSDQKRLNLNGRD